MQTKKLFYITLLLVKFLHVYTLTPYSFVLYKYICLVERYCIDLFLNFNLNSRKTTKIRMF